MKKKSLLFLLALFLWPALSFGCAVCFGGDSGSNLARGFFWGIVVLGILPFAMAGGFVSYLVYFSRKRKNGRSS